MDDGNGVFWCLEGWLAEGRSSDFRGVLSEVNSMERVKSEGRV